MENLNLQPREKLNLYGGVQIKNNDVKNRLEGTGFDHMFKIPHEIVLVKPMLMALIQKYDRSSGLFKLGPNNNVNIVFGLQDVFHITGLPIDGKLVDYEGTAPLGEDEYFQPTGLHEPPNRHQDMKELRDRVNAFNDEPISSENTTHQRKVNEVCRMIALMGIGGMILQDGKNYKINIEYARLLRDVDQIKHYAWGSAAWANLHSSMAAIQNKDKSIIFGCVFALMIFALVRIPKLVPLCYRNMDDQHFPLEFRIMLRFLTVVGRTCMVDGTYKKNFLHFKDLLSELQQDVVTFL